MRRKHEDFGLRSIEVFVDTPLEVREERDPKGLYARARAGEIEGTTGIDDPYGFPVEAGVLVEASFTTVTDAAPLILTEGR